MKLQTFTHRPTAIKAHRLLEDDVLPDVHWSGFMPGSACVLIRDKQVWAKAGDWLVFENDEYGHRGWVGVLSSVQMKMLYQPKKKK